MNSKSSIKYYYSKVSIGMMGGGLAIPYNDSLSTNYQLVSLPKGVFLN